MSTFKSQDDNPHSFTVKLRGEEFQLEQDVSFYKEYAKESRDNVAAATRSTSYKPWCIIPDIVAIDILAKYGIDVHAPSFMNDKEQLRKVAQIMRLEYPDLLMSNITRI